MRKNILLASLLLGLVLSVGSCSGDGGQPLEFGDRVEIEGTGNFDWNNAVKIVLSNGLGEVPYVGWILESLGEIFWPEAKPNIWGEIKDQVKILIDKEITADDYKNLAEKLDGLNYVIQNYTTILNDSQANPQDISDAHEVANVQFLSDLPAFQAAEHSESDKVAFLPLFAQFATMHLALQRDGVLHGKEWGWTDQRSADMAAILTKAIQQYVSYADTTIAAGRKELKLPKAVDPHSATKRWKIENRYYRGMTLLVSDFAHAWPYFDATIYPPDQVTSGMTCPRREIYSDPYGAMDIGYNPPGTNFPTDWKGEHPPKMVTQIEIWAWDRIDAARVWYGGTAAPKMGGNGGSSSPPHGSTFAVDSANPFVAAWGVSGDIPESMGFTHKDGKRIGPLPGGKYSSASYHAGHYDGHILSSINIPGVSGFYQSADAVAFGFRIEACYQPDEK